MQTPGPDQRTLSAALSRALLTGRSRVLSIADPSPREDFARSVARGLRRRPRRLEARFLYDERGGLLYEQICRQPEYYQARVEGALLASWAESIVAATGPATVLELGAGSPRKILPLLSAYAGRSGALHYVPVDVNAAALQESSQEVPERLPDVRVLGLHADWSASLALLPSLSPALVVFLGSTLGNLDDAEERDFFIDVERHLPPGDFLLLGVDLVKDPAVLEAAYDDAAGVTAAFTRNLFVRMNRELGAGLDVSSVRHRARWIPREEHVEITATFTKAQVLRIQPLGLEIPLAEGAAVVTERSRKYRLSTLLPRLEARGLRAVSLFTDQRRRFALLLLQRCLGEGAGGRR